MNFLFITAATLTGQLPAADLPQADLNAPQVTRQAAASDQAQLGFATDAAPGR